MTEKLQIHFSKEDIIEALEDYYAKTKGEGNKINISFDPNNGLENSMYNGGLNVQVVCFINEELAKKKLLEGKLEERTLTPFVSTAQGNVWSGWITTSSSTISPGIVYTNSPYVSTPKQNTPATGKLV